MDDLISFLRTQLDEDERVAREAADGDSGRWFFGEKWNVYRAEDIGDDAGEVNELVVYGNVKPQSEHIARHDPARVLREVEAKRRILDVHAAEGGECTTCHVEDWQEHYDFDTETETYAPECRSVVHPCPTLRWLALPFADRPGYQEEWKP